MELLNLKCEGVRLWGDAQTSRRLELTKNFIGRKFNRETVLDCSGTSTFGSILSEKLNLQYDKTDDNEDFDYGVLFYKYDKYDVIFCFELLEHLMNPLTFLEDVYEMCKPDASVFVSFPRVPRWLMSNRHFHEFRNIEFYTLVDKAGFRIARYESHRNRHDWLFYLTGLRPFIRFWCMLFGLSKIHFYELRLK